MSPWSERGCQKGGVGNWWFLRGRKSGKKVKKVPNLDPPLEGSKKWKKREKSEKNAKFGPPQLETKKIAQFGVCSSKSAPNYLFLRRPPGGVPRGGLARPPLWRSSGGRKLTKLTIWGASKWPKSLSFRPDGEKKWKKWKKCQKKWKKCQI